MSVLTIFVQSENASSERRFDVSTTIEQLKVNIHSFSFKNNCFFFIIKG
jgi:hypothetical protein